MDQGDSGNGINVTSHKKSLQHRYFRKLANNNNNNNNKNNNTTFATTPTISNNEGIINENNQSMGYFKIPAISYSPERHNTRSNSTSPIRNNYSLNNPYKYELDNANKSFSRSSSPTRKGFTTQNVFSGSSNPFQSSENFQHSYHDQTELRSININPFEDRSIYFDNPNNNPAYRTNTLSKYNDTIDTIRYKDTHINSNSDSVFGGYEFDDDEINEEMDSEFTPFPIIENSYYPINMPYDVYNPFEVNYSSNDEDDDDDDDDDKSSSDDDHDRDDNTHNPSGSLRRKDTAFRNAMAVKNAVTYYDMNRGNDEPYNEAVNPNPSTKQVRMVDGNLVLDCPVSEILLRKYQVPLTEKDREFLFMRFQACTAEPEDFQFKKFSLRQNFYTKPRETELMIVITMYNEDEFLLARTLKGVFKNIRHFYSLKHSSTWGPTSWQKIVVCIVSDGRQKINPRSKALLAALGVYQEGFAKNKINDDEVVSHIYEYTTMVGISKIYKDHISLTTDNQIPVQMVFCLKEQNQRKINSHKWAFKAFAPVLNPKVIILLDVGTEPENKSLYKLWKSFKDNPHVAGSCGEIKASLGPRCRLLLNPLIAAQNFEYKTSNILDKPMESVFGFVTVLPGAFSAYRYEALIGDPLEKYLKGEDLKKNNDDGIFNANMYLAEDRILCFELIAKRDSNWILKYINTAGAYTDVPEQLDDFISQRRRWLNGSFFAAVYSVCNFYKVWFTRHSIGRKLMLQIQFFYQLLSLLVSWFSLGSYFLVFRILTCYLAESEVGFAPGNILSVFFLWLYMASLTTTFVLSFGNKPKGSKKFYLVIVIFFAVLMCYMIFASIFLSIKSIKEIISESQDFKWETLFVETQFRNLLIAILSTYLLYLMGFILFLQPIHMLTSFIQYLLLSPAYVNILNIYAFCNIHDISWGTKGQDKMNDLGIAKKGSSGKTDELEIVIPTTKYQIDDGYSKMVKLLMTLNPPSNGNLVDLDEQTKFYYAFFRSMTVLTWMFSNFVLVAIVTNTGGLSQFYSSNNDSDDDDSILPTRKTFIFLSVILYIVAFMALFRFIGCLVYLIQRGLNRFGFRT
ncbi:Chitin synthase, class 1 [Pichia californica]|nr:Chitin synthase, class 1 [[Candida] californica]